MSIANRLVAKHEIALDEREELLALVNASFQSLRKEPVYNSPNKATGKLPLIKPDYVVGMSILNGILANYECSTLFLDKRMAGFCAVKKGGVSIDFFTVFPEFRGLGIGTSMLVEIENDIMRRHPEVGSLRVLTPLTGTSFFERCGYTLMHHTENGTDRSNYKYSVNKVAYLEIDMLYKQIV